MRSEEEIRDELEEMIEATVEQLEKRNTRLLSERAGFISALKWVLEEREGE